MNKNYPEINERKEDRTPGSVLNYFRKAVRLRKENLCLVYGKYKLVDADNTAVYAYSREWGTEKFLILLNFTSSTAKVNADPGRATLVLDNYGTPAAATQLRPYEAAVYKLP